MPARRICPTWTADFEQPKRGEPMSERQPRVRRQHRLQPFDSPGPYLGIFYGTPLGPGPRYGFAGNLFKLLMRLAPHFGLSVFVFEAADLEGWPGQEVGRPAARMPGRLHDGCVWQRRSFPLPAVIYDRALADDPEGGAALDELRHLLPARIPQVNSPAMASAVADKWLVHTALAADPELAAFQPETVLLTRPEDAVAFCRRRKAVILKARSGHKALGVIHLQALAGGGFELLRNGRPGGPSTPPPGPAPAASPAGLSRLVAADETALASILRPWLAGRETLAQQAVARATRADGSGIELRAVMHRTPPAGSWPDPAGRWLRTGMVCRLTDPALPFLALGRETDVRPSAALPAALGAETAARTLDTVRRLARHTAELVERSLGPGGELAVDFLIGRDGQPWLLELNTIPATLFRATGADRLRRRAAERVLRYAAYLAGTGAHDGPGAVAGR